MLGVLFAFARSITSRVPSEVGVNTIMQMSQTNTVLGSENVGLHLRPLALPGGYVNSFILLKDNVSKRLTVIPQACCNRSKRD